MKTISRLLGLSILALLTLSSTAHAHGWHAAVEPQLHLMVHLLQSLGVAAWIVVIGFGLRRRARARTSPTKPR